MNSVKYKVDRSTYSDRLRDFHEWIEAVKKDTLHHVSCCNMHIRMYMCSCYALPCSHLNVPDVDYNCCFFSFCYRIG